MAEHVQPVSDARQALRVLYAATDNTTHAIPHAISFGDTDTNSDNHAHWFDTKRLADALINVAHNRAYRAAYREGHTIAHSLGHRDHNADIFAAGYAHGATS